MKLFKPSLLILLLFVHLPLVNADVASNISLKIDGAHKSLNDFKGKLVYLDFWASWCVPCRKSFPWMNEVSTKYKTKGLEVIAVNLDKDRAMVAKFLQHYPANFKIAYDQAGLSAEKFNVQVMPTSILISRNGNIITKHSGFRKKDREALEQLIKDNL